MRIQKLPIVNSLLKWNARSFRAHRRFAGFTVYMTNNFAPMKSLANNVWTKGCSITILELHSPVTILPIHSQSSHLHCSNSDYSIKNSWKITTSCPSCRARVSTSACAPMNQRHTWDLIGHAAMMQKKPLSFMWEPFYSTINVEEIIL